MIMPISLIVYVEKMTPGIEQDLNNHGEIRFKLGVDNAYILQITSLSGNYESIISELNAKQYVKKTNLLGLVSVPGE